MIFDIYLMNLNKYHYCYDIQSGSIFSSSKLMDRVLELYDFNNKHLIKVLESEYGINKISEAILNVQTLLNGDYLHTRWYAFLSYDHANLVNIKKVFYEDYNELSQKAYYGLTNRLHLDEKIIKQVKISECFYPDNISIGVRNSREEYFLSVNDFIKKIKNKCNLRFNEGEITYIKSILKEISNNTDDFKDIFIKSILNYEIKEIKELMRKIYCNEKDIFACGAGKEFLCISKDGEYYNCPYCTDNKNIKSKNEIGLVFSVYDLFPCKQCTVRFLCGGMCPERAQINYKYCEMINGLYKLMLLYSAYIAENRKDIKENIVYQHREVMEY